MTGRTATTNRSPNSSQTAVFEVRYTKAIDNTGWLWIKLEKDSTPTVKKTVPEYTKVIIQKKEGGRTYFLIKEGVYANRVGSLGDANVSKCLIPFKRGNGAILNVVIVGRQKIYSSIRNEYRNQLVAIAHFNNDQAKITMDSQVSYKESNRNSPYYGQIRQSQPLPKGNYKIMVPDFPKDAAMTGFYRNAYSQLKSDTVWFPIQNAATHNSNFVHVGHLSEGCITFYEIEKWNSIYQYLITNRLDKNGKYVGELIIK